ncbi:TolC family protein [bacterium]|nr:TolC family protein [bacterium]
MTRSSDVTRAAGRPLGWAIGLMILMILMILMGPAAVRSQEAGIQQAVIPDASPVGPVVEARAGESPPLGLGEVVAEVLRVNDLLEAERLKRKELDGQMNQALSNGLPTLDLVGNWSRGRDPSFALDSTFGGGDGMFAPIPDAEPWFNDFLAGFGSFIPAPEAIPAQTFYTTNLSLFWEINPSKVLGAVGAAKLGIDRQELAYRSVKQSTEQATLTAYHGIIKAAERVGAVKAQLANQTEVLDIMRLRHELGMATTLDTLQAAVSLANLRPQLSIAQAGLRNAGSRLNTLMGKSPSAPLRIRNDLQLELDDLSEERALELAVARPELAAAETFVEILGRNRQAQKADTHPYLTVTGSYGYVGRTVDSLFDTGHDSWRAAVALNVPVFDGLMTRGLVAETEARILRAESELSGQRKQVQLEVLEILANLEMAREVHQATELNLQRSEEVLQESLLSLELGKASYLDVLVAEANRAEARAALIDARFEVLDLTAALKRAVGWSPLASLTDIPGLVPEAAR